MPPRQASFWLWALLLLLAAGFGVGGYYYTDYRQAESRREAYRELSAIADLKLRQIASWRQERLADAGFFSHALFVAQGVRQLLDEPQSEAARAPVLNWLNLLKGGDRYEAVLLFDAQLQPRLALPGTASAIPTAYLRTLAAQITRSRDVVMTDLQREPGTQNIYLDLALPVFENADTAAGAPIATVLLRLNARQFLFPLLESWPTPSPTAETLLVRQEGDQVLFLNELRYRPGAALQLRLPMSQRALPAARALRGEEQIHEGQDYRGMPVVAAGRRIPGCTWAMIAKIDRDEVYAPLRQQMRIALASLGGMLLACVLLAALVWHQRELALEKQRAALAERLALVMRYANDIILLFDPAGRVLEANETALRSYGYSLDEIRRLGLADLRAPAGLPQLEQDFARVKTEGTVCFETFHRHKDGRAFPVEVSSRTIRIRNETFILSIIRDITQRKQTEAELRQAKDELLHANAGLERTVQERTARLQETVDDLYAFSYSLSHDMRAPLRAIQSFTGLVQETFGPQLGAEGRQYLDTVISSAQRMTRLIDDVLAFSLVSCQEMTCQPVDIDKLLRALISEHPEFQPPRAQIELLGTLPPVQGHEACLTQCFTNLLGNAVKYVPRGVTPLVRVSSEPQGARVRLWFADNGIGIEPKAHDKVFSLFQRHCPGATYEGNGIGLAIVKKAVERMGGKAGVESALGSGSRFWIELNAAPEPNP